MVCRWGHATQCVATTTLQVDATSQTAACLTINVHCAEWLGKGYVTCCCVWLYIVLYMHLLLQVVGHKGIAIAVSPSEAVLQPWAQLHIQLTCCTDMCGDYVDRLQVQVGHPPFVGLALFSVLLYHRSSHMSYKAHAHGRTLHFDRKVSASCKAEYGIWGVGCLLLTIDRQWQHSSLSHMLAPRALT